MAYDQNAETWSEYGIGIFFLLLRLVARLNMGGIRGLRLDDAFAVLAIIFFTILTVNIHEMGILGTNIGLDAETAMAVPESQFENMILGSKLAFMNWIWYICYIWCLKGVLLCLYWKLTAGTWHRHLVVGSSVFCGIIWLACVLTHVCMCTPIHRNWQIQPYPGDHCTLRQPLYVEIAVFNVLSDICIIVIPIPILAKLQVPLPRKIVLALMFSSGFFIMICTILRAYYSLASITSLPIALGWASRECFVAAIVASLPGIKPLFRNTRILGSSNRKKSNNYYNSEGYNNFGSKASANTKTFATSRRRGSHGRHFELDDVLHTGHMDTRVSTGDSEEYILESAKNERNSPRPHPQNDLAIHVTTEYSLQSEQQRRL
ncbi:uncharacterized protein APUU_31743A [Aspergillus puulaauensis]|uniref:Rhodopsin domain-containing protein n=1 Tax=Aspergillus puulaauensis TaxID=1220207 RepID=A0A7R7XM09_9EURO|nr:uncharacterized protein APUU_31743A [Aspergillus puulaauensis]BCS23518.1 hypothetical protein APUU_31743A [Aspergillus puulaauensis]